MFMIPFFFNIQAALDSNFYQSVDSLRREGLQMEGSQSEGMKQPRSQCIIGFPIRCHNVIKPGIRHGDKVGYENLIDEYF